MKVCVNLKSEPLIDLENDKLETVAQIYFRLTGKRLNPQKLWRWRVKGCRGAKLHAVLLSGAWHTTAKAFAHFIERQTQAANIACTAETVAAERDASTELRLKAAGLLNHPLSRRSK